MRVAIIKSNYTPYGGAEKYTTRLIHAFVKNNIKVDVLTAERRKWDNLEGSAKLVTLKQFKYNNLLRLLSFNSSVNDYFKRMKYDCILGMDRTDFQTHLRAGGGCHLAWLKRRCVECSRLKCLSFRLNPFHNMTIAIERRAFLSEKLKRIFCNSRLVSDDIAHYYPEVKDKLMVVHNGVEWNEFSEPFEKGITNRGELLHSVGLDPDRYYFLFTGSGYERKGLKKAITALRVLSKHISLLVVGKDKNVKKYKAMSERLGLRERVHFYGPQKNIVPFLQVADAFILPTIYDPFSNASLEALAMGLYTITSSANGCYEIIQEGTGSVINDLKDNDSVAEAMNTAFLPHLSKMEIRASVKYLDFYAQLNKIVEVCISDSKIT